MESVKRFFEQLRKDPVTSIRYILVIVGIFVTFQNLFDCITQKAAFYEYFFYVASVGALTLSLIFIHHNAVICFVFALSGVLMIYDDRSSGSISGGIAFFIFSKRIANNLIFSFLIYSVTILVVVANHTFNGRTPADSVNVIIGYLGLYLIDYILEGVQKKL